jgi:hypothetical protein
MFTKLNLSSYNQIFNFYISKDAIAQWLRCLTFAVFRF